MTLLFRLLVYCWVSPVTLLGGLLSMLAVLSGGRARLRHGVWETWGGWPGRLLESGLPFLGPVAAITLGHVVLGISEQAIHVTRVHERAHVRQYELWGLLFLLAYPLASVWAWAKGGHPYRDNPFEREARKADKEIR
ncbi:MAG TPA: hypothetical protein VEP67_08480 [Thiobacillaceae bacterium]|nr:hypothetical protein [Thiobacillaceae bacterium]